MNAGSVWINIKANRAQEVQTRQSGYRPSARKCFLKCVHSSSVWKNNPMEDLSTATSNLIRLISQVNILYTSAEHAHPCHITGLYGTFNQEAWQPQIYRTKKRAFFFFPRPRQEAVRSSPLCINERPEECTNTRHQSCQPLGYHLGVVLEQRVTDQRGDERSHHYYSTWITLLSA